MGKLNIIYKAILDKVKTADFILKYKTTSSTQLILLQAYIWTSIQNNVIDFLYLKRKYMGCKPFFFKKLSHITVLKLK
jgi:hypothetical protein